MQYLVRPRDVLDFVRVSITIPMDVTVQYQTVTKIIANTPILILNLTTTMRKTMDPWIHKLHLHISAYSLIEYL